MKTHVCSKKHGLGTENGKRRSRPWRHALAMGAAVTLALALALAAGCSTTVSGSAAGAASETVSEATATVYPLTVTDDAGRQVLISKRPERIVSLTPGNTEIVCALGAIDRLVGVTAQCDYPEEVAQITTIGDFASPNMEAVTAVDPDVVLVTSGVQADVVTQLEDLGASVVVVDPQSVDALYESITMVGAVIDENTASEELVASMRSEIEDIAERVQGDPVTCFLEIAQNPLYTVGSGTLLNDLIEYAGGQNVVTEDGYVAYSVEQLLVADPEVYLATAGSMSDPADLAGRPGYEDLSAVAEGRVYVLDDNLVSRPGPRIVEGIRALAAALHPDAFSE